eukprot:366178-Chlamydomonas_euryale.AAC.15
MAVQRVEQLALPDVPHLERGVEAGGEQEVARRVERKVGDRARVRLIVLQQVVRTHVPHPDRVVRSGGRDARAVWVERDRVHEALVVIEHVHRLFACKVPHPNRLVVASGHRQASVGREAARAHPVLVPRERVGKALAAERPRLDCFVVRRRQQRAAVAGKVHTAHSAGVSLQQCRLALHRGRPQAHGAVARARRDEEVAWAEVDRVDAACVPREAERPQLRLEVPHHDAVVKRPGDELLHVGVEHDGRDGVLVAAEGALEALGRPSVAPDRHVAAADDAAAAAAVAAAAAAAVSTAFASEACGRGAWPKACVRQRLHHARAAAGRSARRRTAAFSLRAAGAPERLLLPPTWPPSLRPRLWSGVRYAALKRERCARAALRLAPCARGGSLSARAPRRRRNVARQQRSNTRLEKWQKAMRGAEAVRTSPQAPRLRRATAVCLPTGSGALCARACPCGAAFVAMQGCGRGGCGHWPVGIPSRPAVAFENRTVENQRQRLHTPAGSHPAPVLCCAPT